MDPQAQPRYDAQGNEIPPPSASAAPVRYDSQGQEIHPNTPTPPPPTVFHEIGDDLKNLGIGALKSTGRTAVNLAKVVSWIAGLSAATDPTLDATKKLIGVPEGGWQVAGGLAADAGTALLPVGLVGDAAKGAEAAVAAGRLVRAAVRGAVQGGAGAATAALQDQSPVAGAIGGGAIGALSPAAPALEASAGKSMIRALGPSAGRGPTGAEALTTAEDIAPTLVKAGFSPLGQAQARQMAAKGLQKAGTQLQDVLATVGTDPADKAALLQAVAARRAALQVPKAGGGTFLDSSQVAQDGLWQKLESDIQQTDPTVQGMHDLKQRWNSAVTSWGSDPAMGTQAGVYRAGGDLIRAQLSKDSAATSQADKMFSFMSDLHDLVNAPSVRRPSPGTARELLTPFARPAVGAAVGGAEGYREGGVPGAIAGATGGALLGKLIQSSGWQYVSAAKKMQLANMLDKNSAGTSQFIASLLAEATTLANKQDQP